jgi:cytochrome c biogenesis protein CcdA/thiol-disulfide isomerase/thioredoxin
MLLLVLSFFSGALTVLAPCILPLLPVIVGGSVGATGEVASKRKVLVIVLSLGLSVVVFTLLLKVSSALIAIPPDFWTWVSGGIVMVFGFTLLFPGLWERIPFIAKLNASSNQLVSTGYRRKSFWGDVLIGSSLGPVFSSCSPTYFVVLATVLPENFVLGLAYLFAYAAGLCLMLLAVGLAGQKLADRLGFVADPRGKFKRALGFLFIAVGFFIISGQDKQLQVKLLDWGIYDITRVEQWLLQAGMEPMPTRSRGDIGEGPTGTVFDEAMRVAKKERLYISAPEIRMPAGYINTGGEPITIGEFKGKKVVLLDIWTYSCINCQRTIPYLKAWDDTYRDMGLQIIGIHTPEFAFEKDIENVQWAVQQFGLKYPQILDNDYATWRALGNNYWPRKYLVDIDGFIVYDHIGEGSYDETEAAIQRALMERAVILGLNGDMQEQEIVAESIPKQNLGGIGSPEIYFGAWRNERLGNGNPGEEGMREFVAPQNPIRNVLYLDGPWNMEQEYAETAGAANIVFTYNARDVYMVAAANSPVRMRVLRDGKPVGASAGEDVDAAGFVTVQENRLYKLIHDDAVGEHTLELEIEGPGMQAYTFTFG